MVLVNSEVCLDNASQPDFFGTFYFLMENGVFRSTSHY